MSICEHIEPHIHVAVELHIYHLFIEYIHSLNILGKKTILPGYLQKETSTLRQMHNGKEKSRNGCLR